MKFIHHYSLKYGTCFEANIGAEAIYSIFKNLDLNKLKILTEKMIERQVAETRKITKKTSLIRAMTYAGIRPEWMFLTVFQLFHQFFVHGCSRRGTSRNK